MKMTRRILSVLGRDYLKAEEAAVYACVSSSQFRAKAKEYGIYPIQFMGKKVYRKVDIQAAIEASQE
ncbi:hypothetical protein BOW50_12190 [Solemya velum gill symbiont]|nr:hypothetical protein BOW50_12190 [Solemya velum gill symbiont]